jgi:hypothetical protein
LQVDAIDEPEIGGACGSRDHAEQARGAGRAVGMAGQNC